MSFYLMSDELPDPCSSEQDQADQPEPVTIQLREVAEVKTKDGEKEHAERKCGGKFLVIEHDEDQCKYCQVQLELKNRVGQLDRI